MLKKVFGALFVSVTLSGPVFAQLELKIEPIATVQQPWSVAALPDGGFLVAQKTGALRYVTPAGDVQTIDGLPSVNSSGQVGLHDVALAPDFQRSNQVYLTWVAGSGGGALHLGRGTLDLGSLQVTGFETLWRANTSGGRGHPGGIIAFSDDGHLFLTSGDRQLGDPAQSLVDSRGKILRLTLDGKAAEGNPFTEAPEVWSTGHRNPYGLGFDTQGRLWSHEMGPRGGDELNLIVAAENYGWPVVSEGRQYSGRAIPDHSARPEFKPPYIEWTPVIAPAGMIYYDGSVFPEWDGSLLIGGLRSQALVRVQADGETAREVERWEFSERIRDVVADQAGNVYVLEDGNNARLLRLVRSR